jgi:hypothetical protein
MAEINCFLDRIRDTQLRFVEMALRSRPLEEFTIIEVAPGAAPSAPSG